MRKVSLALVMAALLAALPAAAKEVIHEYEGRKLVGELTLAEGKTLADGVVLMVHGTMGHKDMEIMATLRDLLKERGLSTLAINLSLGVSERRGQMECSAPQVHSHREALLDIGVWMQWLQDNGATNVTLLGHSRGGNQAAWYAFERPRVELLKSLVLIAPMTWNPGDFAREYRKRWNQDLQPLLDEAGDLVKRGRGGELMKRKVGFLYCPEASVTGLAFFDYYFDDSRKDTPLLLPGISKPVLVIAASEDDVVPDLTEKMARLDRPNVTFKTIEGADHFFRDLYAEDVADAIAAFLAETGKASAKAE